MAPEPNTHRSTRYRAVPFSLLLILVTAGTSGCTPGAAAVRAPWHRQPAVSAPPPVDPAGEDPADPAATRTDPRSCAPADSFSAFREPPGAGAVSTDPPPAGPMDTFGHGAGTIDTGAAGPPPDPDGASSAAPGAEPVRRAPDTRTPHAESRPPDAGLPAGYRRSLFWSGVLGLLISTTGLALVGSRRRMW